MSTPPGPQADDLGEHAATYTPLPGDQDTGQATYRCRVVCACGGFERTSISTASAAKARENSRRTWANHQRQVTTAPPSSDGGLPIEPAPQPAPGPARAQWALAGFLISAVAVTAIAFALSGLQSSQGSDDTSPSPQRPVSQPTPTSGGNPNPRPTATRSRKPPKPAPAPALGDADTAAALADRGIGEADVRALGFMADQHGYGLSPGTPLSFEQAQNFAVAVLTACDEVADGTTTWAALVDDDVTSGAPPGEAADFWSYVRTDFCP